MTIVHAYLGTVAVATFLTFTFIIRGLRTDFARLRGAARRPVDARRAA